MNSKISYFTQGMLATSKIVGLFANSLLKRATTSIFRFGLVSSGSGSKAHLTIYCNTPFIVSDSKGFLRVISS